MSMDSVIGQMSNLSLEEDRSVVYEVHNAHSDDVHGLIHLGDQTIISGSKDGSVAKWTRQGEFVWRIDTTDNRQGAYTRWVTALRRLSDTHWASGSRDGMVFEWDNNGNELERWTMAVGTKHMSKPRNSDRIDCLAVEPTFTTTRSFFVGQATRFSSLKEGQAAPLFSVKASGNDWVYVMHPLLNKKMLVVTGTDLSLWELCPKWKKTRSIIEDTTKMEHGRRPYISDLCFALPNKISMAIFDGSVCFLDNSLQNPRKVSAHKGRVWSVVKTCNNTLASSGCDGNICIWDVHNERVIRQYTHPFRVSSLLAFDGGEKLLSASCPDRPSCQNGASLTCRDLRV